MKCYKTLPITLKKTHYKMQKNPTKRNQVILQKTKTYVDFLFHTGTKLQSLGFNGEGRVDG